MKTKEYILVAILLIGVFLVGFKVKELRPGGSTFNSKSIGDTIYTKEVLLDSAVMRIQASFLEEDSVASVYLINQLELRPKTGKLILENLRRHEILDEDSYSSAKKNMETYRIMSIYL